MLTKKDCEPFSVGQMWARASTPVLRAGRPSSILIFSRIPQLRVGSSGFDNLETSSETPQSAPLPRPCPFREGGRTKRRKRGWQRAKDDLSWQAQNLGSGGERNCGLSSKAARWRYSGPGQQPDVTRWRITLQSLASCLSGSSLRFERRASREISLFPAQGFSPRLFVPVCKRLQRRA